MIETIHQGEWIRVRYKGNVCLVRAADVEYIEAAEWLCKFYTAEHTVICGKRLGLVCQKLVSHGFVRCHKGFVVNLSKIRKLGATEILLQSGKRIPVGRVYKKDLLYAYRSFSEKKIG